MFLLDVHLIVTFDFFGSLRDTVINIYRFCKVPSTLFYRTLQEN